MKTVFKRWLGVAFALFALLFAASSAAAPRVVWKDTRPEEKGESWSLDLEFYLDKPPDVAHVPIKFEFQPKVYYERALVDDKEGPQLREVPLENKQAIIETVTVSFLDPGRGSTQNRTRFKFKITRGLGFEAGVYEVTVRDGGTGKTFGRPTKLTLRGENEIIDRRSISFVDDGAKKKKKDDQMKKVDKDGNIVEGEENPTAEDPVQQNSDVATAHKEGWDPIYGEPATEPADPEPNPDGEIKEKPGGCGCQLPGTGGPAAPALLLAGALGLAYSRRRRAA